ncbi:cytochrome P450 [Nocardia sp. NBC_01388]|uniref:cytochrome P450 n=1 Tax=Nocardia sp. NBC_01388 TaxID=2903596 RepID=UPI003253AB9B
MPTAPGRKAVLGHALEFRRDPLGFLRSLRSHGDVVRIHLGPLPVYVLTTPGLVHRVLVGEAGKYDKGRLFDNARGVIGNGIITSAGAVHRRHRRMIQPAFHRTVVAEYAEVMSAAASAMADSWKPGQAIEVAEVMRNLTLGIVVRTMVSTDSDRRLESELLESLPVFLAGVAWRTYSPAPFLAKIPIPANRRFDAAVAGMRGALIRTVETARATGGENHDVLAMLLAARNDGSGMTDKQINDELVTLLVAGTETASSALAWIFHEIAHNPEIEARLREEVDAVLDCRSRPAVADLPALTYTRRVVDEALRHYGLPALMRRPTVPVNLGGRWLPAGAELLFSPYALHHDPVTYPEPDRFDPDRESPTDRRAFIPFGGGARQCIGNEFALMEMVIVVATVVARWSLRPAPDHTVRPVVTGVVVPNRLPMIPTPRLAA